MAIYLNNLIALIFMCSSNFQIVVKQKFIQIINMGWLIEKFSSKKTKNNQQVKEKVFYFLSLILCATCTIVKAKIYLSNKVWLNENQNIKTSQPRQRQHEQLVNSQNIVQDNGCLTFLQSTDFLLLFTSFQSVILQILILAIIVKYLRNVVHKQYFVMLFAFLATYFLIHGIFSYFQINSIKSISQIISQINILPLTMISSFGLIFLLPTKLRQFQKYIAAIFYFIPNIGVPIAQYLMSQKSSSSYATKFFMIKFNIGSSFISLLAIIVLLQFREKINLILYQKFGKIKTSVNDELKTQIKNHQIYQSLRQPRHHFIGNDIEEVAWLNQLSNNQPHPNCNILISGFVNTLNNLRKFKVVMVGFVILGWGIIVATSKLIPSLEQNLIIGSSRITSDAYIYHRQFQQAFMIIALAILFLWLIRRIQATYLIIFCQIVVFISYLLIILAYKKVMNLSPVQIKGAVLVGQSFYSSLIIPAIYSEKIKMSMPEILASFLIANWITQLQSKVLVEYVPASALFVLFLLAPIILAFAIHNLNSGAIKQNESNQSQV